MVHVLFVLSAASNSQSISWGSYLGRTPTFAKRPNQNPGEIPAVQNLCMSKAA